MVKSNILIFLLPIVLLLGACSNKGQPPIVSYTPTPIPGLTYSKENGRSFYSLTHASGAYVEYHISVHPYEININFIARIPANVTASLSPDSISARSSYGTSAYPFKQTFRVDFQEGVNGRPPFQTRTPWRLSETMAGASYPFEHPYQTRMFIGSVDIKTKAPETLHFKLPSITINGEKLEFAEFGIQKDVRFLDKGSIRFQ